MIELKPCPFCAVPPVIKKNHKGSTIIECDNPYCSVRVQVVHSDCKTAVNEWNRRLQRNIYGKRKSI